MALQSRRRLSSPYTSTAALVAPPAAATTYTARCTHDAPTAHPRRTPFCRHTPADASQTLTPAWRRQWGGQSLPSCSVCRTSSRMFAARQRTRADRDFPQSETQSMQTPMVSPRPHPASLANAPTQTSPRRARRRSSHRGPCPSSSSCSSSPSSRATFCTPARSRPSTRPSCLYLLVRGENSASVHREPQNGLDWVLDRDRDVDVD